MDLVFVRNQIDLKIKEIDFLLNFYTTGLEKQLAALASVSSEEDKKNLKELFDSLHEIRDSFNENGDEYSLTVIRITNLYGELITKAKTAHENLTKSRTITDNEITITRHELKYSLLAKTIGYHEESKSMDVEYSNGNVYRYFNVSKEYYEILQSRNNLKGFKAEIAQYESKKIN